MAKMDLMSSPALALKMSKEDFDPDTCEFNTRLWNGK